MNRLCGLVILALALLFPTAAGPLALADGPTGGSPGKDKPAASDQGEETAAPEDRYLAITGGVVHTVTGPLLDGATILVKNGKIQALGRNVDIPAAAEKLDATGYHVYPGLVAARSSSLVGSGNPENSTDVFSLSMTMGLAGGITTAVTGNDAAKLTRGTLEGIILRRNLFESISYSTQNPAGRRSLREALERVEQYLRDVEDYEERKRQGDEDAAKPDDRWIRGEYQRALRLLRGEAMARISANRAQEIADVCDLAVRFGFRLLIDGAVEGWIVPEKLAGAGAGAIVTPRDRIDRNEELNRPNGSSIENAAILHARGVPLAIVPESTYISTSGLAGRDLLHLPMEAAFAVRGGLPEEAAIRAITIDAARVLGVDRRVGSIEIGKDADFAIVDGDLLHYMTLVRWTVVNGRIAYDRMKDSLFEHIRPGGDRNAPPPEDYWPRRLGDAP